MEIKKIWEDSELTLEVSGRIDSGNAQDFNAYVKEEAADAEKIIFDMAGLDYISSAGIRVIVMASKMMADREGIMVRNLTDNVYEIFDLVGLIGLLNVE